MLLKKLDRLSKCNKCEAEIGFVRTVKGKWMPVDPEPTTLGELEDGWNLITPSGETWKKRETESKPENFGVEGFACHFDTCKK
jgi:hypothetical protein